jgi:hypothetical protein
VVGWLPPTDTDIALWRVVHADGDEEDLDEEELKAALVEETVESNDEENQMEVDEASESKEEGNTEESDDKNSSLAAEETVVVPVIVKKANGLNKSAHNARHISGLFGLMGLGQEMTRFLNVIAEPMRKKIGDRFNKETKKDLENSLKNVDSLEDLKQKILDIENMIHSLQSKTDVKERDEKESAKERERREMAEEGWTFDESQCEFVGRNARRFFPKFGASDGRIVAFLPKEKNDGVVLYRMIHIDGDREDLDQEDLGKALRNYDENLQEPDQDEDVESDDEDDVDSDDELMIDDASQSDEMIGTGKGFLWPSFEVRERWKESIRSAKTIGEVALAVASLEEQSYSFGIFGEMDPVFPLTLFTSPNEAFASVSTNATRSSGRVHHEILSPRKAKKRALSEISRCHKEENAPILEINEPRRSRRKVESSPDSDSSLPEFYNSGRPSRAAANKVVSYVV